MDRPNTPQSNVRPGAVAFRYPRARDDRRSYGLAILVAVVGATAAALWAITGFLDQIQRPE